MAKIHEAQVNVNVTPATMAAMLNSINSRKPAESAMTNFEVQQ